jgi:regulator of replication initiation timing
MSDDLTTAYMLGAEAMRSKLHKQADEIERLRAENETLRRDVKTAVMGDSAELQDVKRENEKLRAALKPFADAVLKDEYSWKYDINSDDFRAAAAALGETDE